MSSTPPSFPNISDVVQPADLNTWASIAGVLRYLTEPVETPAGALGGSPVATGVMANAFANYYAAARQAQMPHVPSIMRAGWLAVLLGAVGDVAAFLAQLFALILSPFFAAALQFLDGVRKGIDPTVGAISVQVLNEFLGTDFTQQNLPLGLGTGDHLARAQATGSLLMNQLVTEFSPPGGAAVGPSTAPAATFAGLAVNFGIASAIMGVIGGMIPETHLDELRELGEEVAQNIGLGRLVRRALQPLIQILVANPMTWAINTQYLPTQFSIGELINPYAQTSVDQTHLFAAMNLLGYSNDKIQAIIEMHQKRLNPGDVKLLLDYGSWDQPTSEAYITKLNWPAELTPTVLLLEELKEERAWNNKLVAELETEVKNGNVTIDEFETVIRGLPYSKPVQDIIIGTVQYKVKAHVEKTKVAHLGYAQLKQAFEQGIATITDLTDRWTAQGYSQADQDILTFLVLFDLQQFEAAQAKKAATAAKKASTTTSPTTGKVTG